jgi:type I restriction enzyme S subunit
MAGEWTPTTLAKVLSFSNGKSSPDRADSLPFPVYGSNGIIGFASETNAEPNTIVIGRVGSYCGSLYFSKKKCWVTDNAIRASAIDDNDAKFLLYLLQTLDLNHWRAGSGQPLLNQTILGSIPTSIPEPDEQRAIAHILGTLDDKIELNRRMNETLEAIARAIFKSWFVDFDPVRAKMSGESPESICQRLGVAPDLLVLFPDRLVDSELGEIPERWRVATVDDEFDLTMGQSPPGSSYNEVGEGLPFYQGRTDFGFRFPTRRVFCTAPTRLAETGDTLISVRAPVGDINMADEKCCIGRGVAAARHK